MEDWHDVVSLLFNSLLVAGVIALVVSVPLYLILRLVRLTPRFRKEHSWKSDLLRISQVAAVFLVIAFVASASIGYLFSGMCGTGRVTEAPSPDAKHKIVVYNFDCGATTDFSLDVSLLRADEKLPKYKTAKLLYHHYHQVPVPLGKERNFEVQWLDPSHVTVRVEGLDDTAKSQRQDGVQISFERLP
jgi:hypothetical protein